MGVKETARNSLLLSVLFCCYGIGALFGYGQGFLQACWVNDGSISISRKEAASISSVSFLFAQILYLPIQLFLRQLKVKPWLILAFNTLLAALALFASFCSSSFWALLVANGVLLGTVRATNVVAYFSSLNSYVPDRVLHFYHGVCVGGTGCAILLLSALFAILEQPAAAGWRHSQEVQLSFCLLLGASAFLLHPRIAGRLGFNCIDTESNGIIAGERQQGLSLSSMETSYVLIRRVVTRREKTLAESLMNSLKNFKFDLYALCYALSCAAAIVIYTFELSRMVDFGIPIPLASSSFLITGSLEIVLRPLMGYLISYEMISPICLGISTKVIMVVLICLGLCLRNILSEIAIVSFLAIFQSAYVVTDVIVITGCVEEEEKETGMALLQVLSGMLTAGSVQVFGSLYEQWGSMQIQYAVTAGGIALAGVLSVVASRM